jgi:FtsH-binding integral membrane protein
MYLIREDTSISSVFMWMFFGLFITGGVSFWTIDNSEVMNSLFHKGGWLFWGLLILELIIVIVFSALAETVNEFLASALFIAYSVLNGFTLSVIFLVYTRESIYSTFFITSGMFGLSAVYGYVTKKDLTSWGSILFMAVHYF